MNRPAAQAAETFIRDGADSGETSFETSFDFSLASSELHFHAVYARSPKRAGSEKISLIRPFIRMPRSSSSEIFKESHKDYTR
jgi:hypothetical protein